MFKRIISLENLLGAWREFKRGKAKKPDVQEFYSALEENLFELRASLQNKTYKHGGYHAFKISDPKPRDIHKATVRDRLLHHAIYRELYLLFDNTFIHDSYSCRERKGTHHAMNRFRQFANKVSRNHTRTCWVLKCDIRKFFASIDQNILAEIISRYIPDRDIQWLIGQVVRSFHSPQSFTVVENRGKWQRGLPLGNLTSQLLVNIYMNEFDQYIKHKLKVKYYVRYADDFVILSHDREWLQNVLPHIEHFLRLRLNLNLHPDKVFIKTFASGVDFLGWVHFSDHRVLRTSTKRRMFRRTLGHTEDNPTNQSYLGLLSHGNSERLRQKVRKRL